MGERARVTVDMRAPGAGARRRWMPTLAAGLSLGEYARSLVRRLAALTAVLVTAIWALERAGLLLAGVGLAGPRACPCCSTSRRSWAWRHPRGAVRRVACVWALVSVAAVILLLTWLLTWLLAGVHEFWPAWALLGPGHGGQRLLAVRAARPRAGRPRTARAASQDRAVDAHPPPGRGRPGGRAAADRARPARRGAGAAGRADAAAGTSRAAGRRPARGPRG